jgi:anti-anti-sigma regulatory factor
MLKITVEQQPDSPSARFVLEGRLKGEWVDELARAWKASQATSITMDLRAVDYISEPGEALLHEMHRAGVQFPYCNQLTKSCVDGMATAGDASLKLKGAR